MAIVYKVLEDGNSIEMSENGHPMVYDDEDEDVKPYPIRATELLSVKIPTLQAEAKKYREGFKNLEPEDVHKKLKTLEETSTKLRLFGDIDPEKAKEALETIANLGQLDQEKTIEIDKIRANVEESWKIRMEDKDKAYNIKVTSLQSDIESKNTAIRDLLIRGAFDASEFIRDKTLLPPDIAYASFGKHFKVEEDATGKLKAVAYDNTGDRILSLKYPSEGETALPEEAIEKLVNQYSKKESILKTSGAGGSGSGGNTNTNASKRQEAERLSGLNPTERLTQIWK